MQNRWAFVYCVGLVVYSSMLQKSNEDDLKNAEAFGKELWQIIWNYQICGSDITNRIVSFFMRLWGIFTYKYKSEHESDEDIFNDVLKEKLDLIYDYPFAFVDFIEGLMQDTTGFKKESFYSVIIQNNYAEIVKEGYNRVIDYYSGQDYIPFSENERNKIYKQRTFEIDRCLLACK
jgi:hypothetical protein